MSASGRDRRIAFVVLGLSVFAMFVSDRAANATPRPYAPPRPPSPPRPPAPAPPEVSPVVPRERPRPVELAGSTRYRFVVDVIPTKDLRDVARRLMPRLGLEDVDVAGAEHLDDRGVVRVTFDATTSRPLSVAFGAREEHEGIAVVWVISAQRIDPREGD